MNVKYSLRNLDYLPGYPFPTPTLHGHFFPSIVLLRPTTLNQVPKQETQASGPTLPSWSIYSITIKT